MVPFPPATAGPQLETKATRVTALSTVMQQLTESEGITPVTSATSKSKYGLIPTQLVESGNPMIRKQISKRTVPSGKDSPSIGKPRGINFNAFGPERLKSATTYILGVPGFELSI